MVDNRNQMLNYAIHASFTLGIFWVVKYLFVILGQDAKLLAITANILSVFTPLLLLNYLFKYNKRYLDNKMSFWQGMQFAILLFFFASILESVIVFIHIRWIDPFYISNLYERMTILAKSLPFSAEVTEQFAAQPLPSSFSYVFTNVILGNVFIGILLSLILVPFSKKMNREIKSIL